MYSKRIVWVDLRSNQNNSGYWRLLPKDWPMEKVNNPDYVVQIVKNVLPCLLIFEFDRPDSLSLSGLRNIRQHLNTIPLLMLTKYHSEELAVWALRNRVSNYVVIPVSQDELLGRIKESLSVSPIGGAVPDELCLHAINQCKTAPAVAYVKIHYQEKVKEELVADACNMSVSTFSRLFRKEQGKTFREYLLEYRIEKARNLLLLPGVSVTNAAFSVGFNSASYFSKMFKRFTGRLPSNPH